MKQHQYPVGHKIGKQYVYLAPGVRSFFQAISNPRVFLRLFSLFSFIALPQLVNAEPWDEGAEATYDAIVSVVRWVGLIAIIFTGMMCMFGKMALQTAGMIIGGIVIMVGAEAIYDFFEGSVT